MLAGNRYRLLTAIVALATGVVVFGMAHELLPYHSSNHDEGVYLQQAAMLLDGQLFVNPGSEPLREAFHPWFFVESDAGLYPKYAPVPAAVFALGKLAGGYRFALAGIAAANIALCYGVASAAFDRQTGLLAAVTMAGAPLFLFPSIAFLPYAPTTALNLLFAFAYVRSVRGADRRCAGLAGISIGLAFFARPFTAVLFATPFVGHALWHLWRSLPADWSVLVRQGTVAGLGLCFVGVTLAYNATVTGSALLFPYEAFAPLDGPGFGYREILGHDAEYTPELALRANGIALRALTTEWFTAGPLGTAAALGGAITAGVGIRREGLNTGAPLSDRRLQILLLAMVPVVVAGNVYFWGNLNILGNLQNPDDGIISLFGPFYHFDLLVVLSVFAAHGTISLGRFLARLAREHVSVRTVRIGALLCLALALPVVGIAEASVVGPPAERHAAYTEKFEGAYGPFEEGDLDNALVFLPPTYGEWRNHPFQYLRNDPDFDGGTVYATARNPEDDFAVLDAYPDREYHRYRYNGEWTPDPDRHVQPVLEPVRLVEGSRLSARTRVAVPERVTTVAVAVSTGDAIRRYNYEGELSSEITIDWTIGPDGIRADDPALAVRTGEEADLGIDRPQTVALAITLNEPGGGTLTYREEALVRPTDSGVEAVWPPQSTVCTLVTDCGLEGTYVPDKPETRPDGIEMNTTRDEKA